MKIIKGPRQCGKTTMLLHYMVIDDLSVYVAITEDYAKRAYQRSQELGLGLDEDRFVGMCGVDRISDRCKLLVDDADVITRRHPELGYNLLSRASVITICDGVR